MAVYGFFPASLAIQHCRLYQLNLKVEADLVPSEKFLKAK